MDFGKGDMRVIFIARKWSTVRLEVRCLGRLRSCSSRIMTEVAKIALYTCMFILRPSTFVAPRLSIEGCDD